MTTTPVLLTPPREAALRRALAVLVPLGVFAVAAGRTPFPVVVAVALAVAAGLAVLAARWPTAAALTAVVVVAVVPFYDGRYVTGSVGVTPMVACCLVLAPAAWLARGRVRLGALDVAVAVLVVVRAIAYLLNYSTGLGAVLTVVLGTALPYAVFRPLTVDAAMRTRLAAVVVAAAAALSALSLQERTGAGNLFFTLLPARYQAAQWARPELRFDTVRVEASFGHPIAFGMFLAVALVLAIALTLTVRRLWHRVAVTVAAGLILFALTATLSRGPLLVAALAGVAWLVVTGRRVDVRWLLAALTVLAAVVVTTPIGGTITALRESSVGDTREARSADYRLEVLSVVRDREQFSLLGRPTVDVGGITPSVSRRSGLKSIDSEFALVYLTTGAVALAVFVLLALLVWRTAVRRGLGPMDRAWALAMAASYLNLLTVALLTQQAELFWAFTAVAAGIAQGSRRGTHR